MGIGANATPGTADEGRAKGEADRGYEGQSQIEGPIEICNGQAMWIRIETAELPGYTLYKPD